METAFAGWGRGWYLRAHNIPAELRGKICCHCGRVIKWGEEANLKDVPVPFSAHRRCHDGQRVVHMSVHEYETLKNFGKIQTDDKHGILPVNDENFRRNIERSEEFLRADWYKKPWMLFLTLLNGEEL